MKLERSLPSFLGRLCMENVCCWRFLCHSIMHYTRISCLQSVELQYWKSVSVFAEEENSHDRKAVAVTRAERHVVGHLHFARYLAFISISSCMEAKLTAR